MHDEYVIELFCNECMKWTWHSLNNKGRRTCDDCGEVRT